MAATFRTRPWLTASSRATLSPSLSLLAARGLQANLEQTRQYAAATRRRIDPRFRNAVQHTKKSRLQQEATSSLMMDTIDHKNHLDTSEMAVLAPRTVVTLPLSRAPREPKKFFRYYWEILKTRFADRAQILQQTVALKETFFSRAKFRAERKGIVEAALRLHAEMSQNLAAGGAVGRANLAKICVPKLHRSLVAAIESRPRGKSYRWERLATTGRPRIMDHKWTEVDVGVPMTFRQAVVRIKSKQRLTELDARGNEVGSGKVLDLLEYLVLWRTVDKMRLTEGDWLVYGTLKETTLEELEAEAALVKSVSNARAATKLLERQAKLDVRKGA